MPKGEHLKEVTKDELLQQFDKDNPHREFYLSAEIAEDIPIQPESVRQRLQKLEGTHVESEKIGNTRCWYLEGADPFSDSNTTPNTAIRQSVGVGGSNDREIVLATRVLAILILLAVFSIGYVIINLALPVVGWTGTAFICIIAILSMVLLARQGQRVS